MKSIVTTKEHHRVRSFLSSFFGAVTLSLISLSIVVVWLNGTFTNTDQYVKTVGPLAHDRVIQDFVASQSTAVFLDGDEAPAREIAEQLLGKEQTTGKTDEQLKLQVQPVLQEDIRLALATPEFAELWESNSRTMHRQFLAQIAGDSPTLTFNFQPLIVGAVNILTATKLSFLKDKIEIKGETGQATLPNEQLAVIRKFYDYSGELVIAVLTLAVISFITTLAISVHRLYTLRRIVFSAGISAALLVGSLSLPSLLAGQASRPEQQKFALTLIDVLTRDFRATLIIIAAVCIGVTAISKVVEIIIKRRQ